MIRVATLGVVASLAIAPAALAAGRDRLPYTGIEASYGRLALDKTDAGADRLDVRATLEPGGPVPVFVSASRVQVETDELRAFSVRYSTRSSLSRVDLGFHLGEPTTDFVPSISLVEVRGEFLGDLAILGDYRETGWAARTAVRTLVRPWLEIGAFIETMFVSENATATAAAEGIFYPFRHLGVGVGWETTEGQQAVLARVRIVQ